MLIIVNDPQAISGRHRFELEPSITLQANIERHLQSGYECSVSLNGETINPATDSRMDECPTPDDVVVVTRRPAGLDPVSNYLATQYAASEAVNALVNTPRVNDPDSSGGYTKSSPNNGLTSQSNIARAYQAIPDVYGYRRVWPDLIQPSLVEYIDNTKYITEWLCVSRGIGDVAFVQYADSDFNDIAGASYAVFAPTTVATYPELAQTTLTDVYEPVPSPDVNGQELLYPGDFPSINRTGSFVALSGATSFTVTVPDGAALDNLKARAPSGTARVWFNYGSAFDQTCTVLSYTQSGGSVTFTFSSTSWGSAASGSGVAFTFQPIGSGPTVIGPFTMPAVSDRIWFNVTAQRGLKGTVNVKMTRWHIDDAGAEVAGTRSNETFSFSADTLDQKSWTTKVEPPAGSGRYVVQFERTSAQVNADGIDVLRLEEVFAVRYYPTKTLPGVTVIRVTTKATSSSSGYSERKFNLRWTRHVRRLDSPTIGPSRNFARTMAHIWAIAGNADSQLDLSALAAINTEFGEDSPLLRFDGSLDDADVSLGERLQTVANHARCTVWRDGPRWTVTREQAKPYPEMQFDYRNLAGGGESAISYAAHMPASFDGIELEYVKETTQAIKGYVRLNVSSGAIVEGQSSNPKKVKLPGCTTYTQALNRARLEARRLLFQKITVTDMALSDARALGLGALVRWVDPSDFLGDDIAQAGEVAAFTGSTITTSEPLQWRGEASGRIQLTGEDGLYIGAPLACTPIAGGVSVASVPAGVYVADAARQCGSRYVFAPGVSAAELESAGLYTLSESKPSGDGQVSITLAQYDARMFEDD